MLQTKKRSRQLVHLPCRKNERKKIKRDIMTQQCIEKKKLNDPFKVILKKQAQSIKVDGIRKK